MEDGTLALLLLLALAASLALALAPSAQAQGSLANVTIRIYDCAGSSLVEGGRAPRLVVYNDTGGVVFDGECAGTCKLVNLTPGRYEFKVYWRGVLVASVNETLSSGENLVDIETRVVKARIRVVDDAGASLRKVSLTLRGPKPEYTLEFEYSIRGEDQITTYLPFGEYALTKLVWKWEVGEREVTVDVAPENASYELSASSDLILIEAKVFHSLVLGFYTLDEERVEGDVVIEFAKDTSWIKVFEGEAEDGRVRLNKVPYGLYRITMTWREATVLKEVIEVDSELREELEEGELRLTASLYERIFLKFVNSLGEPLEELAVLIRDPLGENRTYTTTRGGLVELENAVSGRYTAYVRWAAGYLEEVVDLTPEVAENGFVVVEVELVDLLLTLVPKGSSSIPRGLKVHLETRGTTLLDEELEEEVTKYEREIPKLYTKSTYELRVEYGNYVLFEGPIDVSSGEFTVDLEMYDLVLRVLSNAGYPLVGARVVLELPRGGTREALTESGGIASFRHLVAGFGDHRVTVYWRGYRVGEYVVRDDDLEEGRLDLSTRVYDLLVRVVGWFGRGLEGARVSAYLRNSSARLPIGNSTTDPAGLAKIEGVPVPSGYDVILDVCYKERYREEGIMYEKPGEVKEVFLDVFLEIAGYPLSAAEVAMVVVCTAVLIAASYYLYRFVESRRIPKEIFAEGIKEEEVEEEEWYEYGLEEEAEEEGLLSRLRKKLRSLLG